LSYSYIDTKETIKLPYHSNSKFCSWSLSLVTKYFITDWRSQIGFTNSFSSGRPTITLMKPNSWTENKAYNSLSFNWAYLISQQKICISRFQMSGTQNVLDTEIRIVDFITEKKLFLLPIDSFRWFLLDNKQWQKTISWRISN
jgi:hypothetical protein